MKEFLKEENKSYCPKDFTITIIEEYDQKLKFAVWDHMEFLSEKIRIDNPENVIDTIRNAVEKYFTEYSPISEFLEGEIEG